ncbi:MAG: PAS domain-containing protein [Thalassobaculum sp.]|uniref:PAS domain-containing protein n=1 Tax=Thalassobaculum sp. TaxID=2022740 RepID=UPI0032EE5C38
MISFRSRLCQSLYEYWLGLPKPAGGILPLKSALDPAAIPRLLPRVVLHDLRQPGRSIIRLAGTGMAAQYGFDPSGHDYIQYVAPERRESALGELIKVAGHPCGMKVLIEQIQPSGAGIVSESAGFPFESDDGGGRFLLFVDEPLDRPNYYDPLRKPLEVLTVHERLYIDIGAGVPSAATEPRKA